MTTTQIQHLLGYLGYYDAAVDGCWGARSAGGCRRFQAEHGLTEDGIPGPATQEKLLAAVAEPTREDAPGTAPEFWRDIRYFTRADPYIACPCGACGGFPADRAKYGGLEMTRSAKPASSTGSRRSAQ